MMFISNITLIFLIFGGACASLLSKSILYDAYYGRPVSNEDLRNFKEANITTLCTNDIILPCDATEGRRPDGSGNHLKNPSRGAMFTPFARILPASFSAGYEPRKAKCGNELPTPRHLSTSLLPRGDVPSEHFTFLVPDVLIFFFEDFLSLHDLLNYLQERPYCCTPKGETDDMCAPISVPEDDPVFRLTDVSCLNLTKPITYQNTGCVKNDTIPSRRVYATPFMDLSQIYGKGAELSKARLYKNGLLKYEMEDGRIWPPSLKKDPTSVCYLNQLPRETRCHDMPDPFRNIVVGSNLLSIWMWRYHNKVAKNLAEINPCWSDEKIFNIAKDINIAVASQIYYYEVLSLIMGQNNLVNDGVISNSSGFRDIYDENHNPETFIEFLVVGRWLHTTQPGKLSLFDKHGNYIKEYEQGDVNVRTGFLAVDDNIDYITQGCFRQPAANIDHVVDNLMGNYVFGPLQRAADVTTSDFTKNRLFGLAPYVKYRDYCTNRTHKNFDDLADVFDPERLEMLQKQYEHVDDIDLLSAIWLERPVEGGYVPATFYCVVAKQLLNIVKFDRHWYERADRPNAFTHAQLQEVRKATIAQLLCDVGDSITKVQPNAFLRESPENKITSCSNIPRVELDAWKDKKCHL